MNQPDPDQPPVFKSWSGWYWLVASVLFIQIIIYTVLTYINK